MREDIYITRNQALKAIQARIEALSSQESYPLCLESVAAEIKRVRRSKGSELLSALGVDRIDAEGVQTLKSAFAEVFNNYYGHKIVVPQLLRQLSSEGRSAKEAKRLILNDAKLLRRKDPKTIEKYSLISDEAVPAARYIRHLFRVDNLFGEQPLPDIRDLTDTVGKDFTYTKEEKLRSAERIRATRTQRRGLRIASDATRGFFTAVLSLFTLVVLLGIVVYIFQTGGSTLSWNFITGKNASEKVSIYMDESDGVQPGKEFQYNAKENEFFSPNWGVALTDSTDSEGKYVLKIAYIDKDSPFLRLKEHNSDADLDGSYVNVGAGWYLSSAIRGKDADGKAVVLYPNKDKAEKTIAKLDTMSYITSGTITYGGGGIVGPLITTLWMILFSLVIALPLGIGGAVYLSIYAKKNILTKIIRSLVDMISGIPSIIFGLAGAIIFIPIFSNGGSIGNILSGSATLACVVLPTIIKAMEEAINVIPPSISRASLALGASRTQTVFKVIIPNAVPGILTGSLLATGRIIGESAALVFATGTIISDTISPVSQAPASLAVYIWKVMSGEAPNYRAASAAAILILIVVLILNLLVKLIASKFDKFTPRGPKSWARRLWDKMIAKIKTRQEIRNNIRGGSKPLKEGASNED